MFKKYFALLLAFGFFAILPSAVAEDQTTITHDAPAEVRLPQNTHDSIILLTLRARNIQVQAQWTVDSNHSLTISNDGVLSIDKINRPTQVFATVVLEDLFNKLNDNYTNLSVQITITIDLVSGLVLADAPPLQAIFGVSVSLHTFTLTTDETGAIMYSLVNDNNSFSIDDDGLFSSSGQASVGQHTLTIQAQINALTAYAVATVEIIPTLSLSDAPPLFVRFGETTVLHTFTASGGINDKTYTLQTAITNYFSLAQNTGTLSLVIAPPIGVYRLTIIATDEVGNAINAYATVHITGLVLAQVPPLQALFGQMITLHTIAVTTEQTGAVMYSLVGHDNLFGIDDDGRFYSLGQATVGQHTLTIQAQINALTAYAVATVEIFSALSLSDAPPLFVRFGKTTVLHTFTASGGINDKTYTLQTAITNYFSLAQNTGTLSLVIAPPIGVYRLTIIATDEVGNAINAYATVHITGFILAQVPPLQALFGQMITLYTIAINTEQTGAVMYSLVHHDNLFGIAADGRFYSLGRATVGQHTLTIQAQINALTTYVVATVEIFSALSLSDAPPLFANIGDLTVLHTFTAEGGINNKTYTLLVAPPDYFLLEPNSGVLSLVNEQAEGGIYLLTIRVRDQNHNALTAYATVHITGFILADAPPLSALEGQTLTLHTFTVQTDNKITPISYTLLGTITLFGVDQNGDFSSLGQASTGSYTLTIQAHSNTLTTYAVATVNIFPALSLADIPLQFRKVGINIPLRFLATGGIGHIIYQLQTAAPDDYFRLNKDTGILSFVTNDATVGVYLLTISATDRHNNSVAKVATVYLIQPLVLLAAPPPLESIAGAMLSLYSFSTEGGAGDNTYTIMAGDAAFAVPNGVLSVSASLAAGVYSLTIVIADHAIPPNLVTAWATVEIFPALSLAAAPPLFAEVGDTRDLHKFTAAGGIRSKTYTFQTAMTNYFAVAEDTGVLSLVASPAAAGSYWVTIIATDEGGNTIDTVVTVHFIVPLFLPAPPPINRSTGAMLSLYTFVAEGGFGDKTYTIIDDDGTFTVRDGVLSVFVSIAVGEYSLAIDIADSAVPPHRITASVMVKILPSDRMFMLGGNRVRYVFGFAGFRSNNIWSSADGVDWLSKEDASWPSRNDHQAIVHQGQIYVLGGKAGSEEDDVWSSEDGMIWTEKIADAEWPRRRDHRAVSHNGTMYVLGGQYTIKRYDDVWSSEDGTTWTKKTSTAARWTPRQGHQVVVYHGRMYLLGGYGGTQRLNDVWSSANGEIWSLETDAAHGANWPARSSHQAVVHHGTLYVLGGYDGTNYLNDIWSSTDGKNWAIVNSDAPWPARNQFSAQSFQGTLYVIGGSGGEPNYYDDVWSSVDGEDWEKVGTLPVSLYASQSLVFPPPLELWGVGEALTVTAGVAQDLHTFTAQYGKGAVTYSLLSTVAGFAINHGGVLSVNNNAVAGSHRLTIQVMDEEEMRATTVVRVRVVNSS